MLERLLALQTFGVKLGLDNITRLCEGLGHPERAFQSIHIAGTNGKGSVAAMEHAGLVAAGIPAGRYTSPHLTDLAERFVIGRHPVAADRLDAAADDVLDLADALVRSGALPAPPTFFEATTAIAFELFRRGGVPVAVVEVGLGGRYDATNVIDPLVTAITSIGMDHERHLGSTLTSIAYEKAGIIKPGVPVVIGPLAPDAMTRVAAVAAARDAPIITALRDVHVDVRAVAGRSVVTIRTPRRQYNEVQLALRGRHQVDNAVVAVRVMEALGARGIELPSVAIEAAMTTVEWPGRLELSDLGGGRRVLLDAAHNPDGATALARYLSQWHPERPPLVFAAMTDKDVGGMLRVLLPVVGPVIVTAPEMRRAADPVALASLAHALDPGRDVVAMTDPVAAVAHALTRAPTVCVAGSIFLVGAVRGPLHRRAILP